MVCGGEPDGDKLTSLHWGSNGGQLHLLLVPAERIFAPCLPVRQMDQSGTFLPHTLLQDLVIRTFGRAF